MRSLLAALALVAAQGISMAEAGQLNDIVETLRPRFLHPDHANNETFKGVIRAMAHRVLVMKDGRVVEQGDVDDVLSAPSQPYTQRLLAASTYSTAAVDA